MSSAAMMRIGAALLHRLDGLITRERVQNYSWICLVLGAVALVLNAALGHGPVTVSGTVVLPDYLAHWTGGRMVLDGRLGALYDPAAQAQLQHQEVAVTPGLSWFVSPPVALLLYLPLGWLPYPASAVLWTALSAGMLAASLVLAKPLMSTGRPRDYLVLVLVFVSTPAVLELLGAGQDSGVALIALMLGLRLLHKERNVAAGVILALGIIKPQLFVLVPVALVILQRYRALLACGASTVILAAASLPLVGLSSWRAWHDAVTSSLYSEAVQVGQTWKMQSVSSLATSFGAPSWVAYALLGLGAAALVVRARQVRADTAHVWALTMVTTVVFSPHVMLYDLVVLLPVATFVRSRANSPAVRLLSVATAVLLATIGVRHLFGGLAWPWAGLAAPWSALPLFGLWLVLMRLPAREVAVGQGLADRSCIPGHTVRSSARAPVGGRRWPTLPR